MVLQEAWCKKKKEPFVSPSTFLFQKYGISKKFSLPITVENLYFCPKNIVTSKKKVIPFNRVDYPYFRFKPKPPPWCCYE